MRRQQVGARAWFDLDRAECWRERTRWDGSNHVSINTGSQWHHEELYQTASGAWVIHAWSQWQGTGHDWYEVTEQEAGDWLARNGYDHAPAARAAIERNEI